MPQHASIRATPTGKALATVRPPRPYSVFTFVTGAGDDRTSSWPPSAGGGSHGARGRAAEQRNVTTADEFFRLRFDPATRTARLTPLQVPQEDSSGSLSGIAVSPDGTKLAMTLHPGRRSRSSPWSRIGQALDLARAAHSTRVWVGNDKPDGQPLSWAADGRRWRSG